MVNPDDAALGAAFGELVGLVKHAVKIVAAFRGRLKKIESTLKSIEPIINEIEKYNNLLHRSPEEMAPIKDLLEEGKALVNECLNIHMLNMCMKYTHSKKLTDFNAAVVEKFQIYMPLLNVATSKDTSVRVKNIEGDVKDIGGDLRDVKDLLISVLSNSGSLQGGLDALSLRNLAVPAAPDFLVGWEVEASLSKLKEGMPVTAVTAPGRCGKTTLLKKLCHNEAIEEADEDEHSEEEEQPTNVEPEDDEQVGQKEAELVESPIEEAQHVKSQLRKNKRLPKALQESLTVESPPQYESGSTFRPYPFFFPPLHRICAGRTAEIGGGRFLSCMGSFPECFCCHACNHPIINYEVWVWGNRPYHKACYKEQHYPTCDVCKSYIPANAAGFVEYGVHPFWLQKYCPSHEWDGTPKCCSCERMEPRDNRYLSLDDGRKLCLECLDSAIMDTHECQVLYLEILEFYKGLNMKVEQQIPLLLVEREVLNEAGEGEKSGNHHMPETRGLCLSEEQCVTTIMRRPRIGSGYRIVEMITEPFRLVRQCEVTAILILYGLPRLLTGSILAHEMMHAWLRLKGFSNISPEVEEGICQVLAHLWLESEIYSSSGSDVTSSSSSSSLPSSFLAMHTVSKKSLRSSFEKMLGEFMKHQIESDSSAAYGQWFRLGNQPVLKYGLRRTLDHIRLTGSFPV